MILKYAADIHKAQSELGRLITRKPEEEEGAAKPAAGAPAKPPARPATGPAATPAKPGAKKGTLH